MSGKPVRGTGSDWSMEAEKSSLPLTSTGRILIASLNDQLWKCVTDRKESTRATTDHYLTKSGEPTAGRAQGKTHALSKAPPGPD